MPNGQYQEAAGTGQATCVGCECTQSTAYPGLWGRSPGLGILLLNAERSVGLCVKCVTPVNLSKYWRAIAPAARA
jgi:hypothetical protein